MLIPTKHEVLERNLLVVGAKIIEKILKKDLTVEELVEEVIKDITDCTLDTVLDALTFLFCLDAIYIKNYFVRLKQ